MYLVEDISLSNLGYEFLALTDTNQFEHIFVVVYENMEAQRFIVFEMALSLFWRRVADL
jgi:hypothetical protein